jgi:hypothetical protein
VAERIRETIKANKTKYFIGDPYCSAWNLGDEFGEPYSPTRRPGEA